jgi:hypothetical protein
LDHIFLDVTCCGAPSRGREVLRFRLAEDRK